MYESVCNLFTPSCGLHRPFGAALSQKPRKEDFVWGTFVQLAYDLANEIDLPVGNKFLDCIEKRKSVGVVIFRSFSMRSSDSLSKKEKQEKFKILRN